jgi:hypothetical protein
VRQARTPLPPEPLPVPECTPTGRSNSSLTAVSRPRHSVRKSAELANPFVILCYADEDPVRLRPIQF